MSIEAMKLALEALAPLEKLFTQADEQGLLAGANVDCQIATIELRKSAYAASDIRAYLNATPPEAQVAPVQEPVAQAWDEGYRAGVNDERMSEANIGIAGFDAKVEPARNNPYRTTPPAAQQAVAQGQLFAPEQPKQEQVRMF